MEDILRPLALNFSQYNVLKNLNTSQPLTGAELARKAFVTPQTMHTILTTMERKGFVTRTSFDGNGKSFHISITDSGIARLMDAEKAFSTIFEKANHALSSSEHTKLDQLLKKLLSGLKDV